MRVALLTYSTKPRGGVVHTLALAESLADLGVEVDVWTLGRGGDTAFFRPVAANVGVRTVPFEARDEEPVGTRIMRSIAVLAAAFRSCRRDYDIIHAQDCISANAAMPCIRTIHHLDHFTTPQRLPRARRRRAGLPDLRLRRGRRGGAARLGLRADGDSQRGGRRQIRGRRP
jgi:hypothetical protein